MLLLCEDPFILSFTKYVGTQISEIVLEVVLLWTAPILCRKVLKKASVLSLDIEKSSFLAMSKHCIFHSWSPKWVGFWTFSLGLHLLFGRWYCSWDPAEQLGGVRSGSHCHYLSTRPLHRNQCEGSWRLHAHSLPWGGRTWTQEVGNCRFCSDPLLSLGCGRTNCVHGNCLSRASESGDCYQFNIHSSHCLVQLNWSLLSCLDGQEDHRAY